MATLQAQDIADIVAGGLRELNRKKSVLISQALQRYEVISHWFTKDRILLTSGYGYQRTLESKLDETAADHVGLYEEDVPTVADLLVNLQVDWVHARTKWAYSETELMMNSGSAQIVDIVKARETGAFIKLADKLEAAAWSLPAASATKFPWNIPYYAPFNATEGFNGTTPTGYTLVAGIDPTVHTNYKSYTDQYTDVTTADLIRKWRLANLKIQFFSPLAIADRKAATEARNRYRIYVDATTRLDIEDRGTAQNDNLGPDIAKMDGMMVFNGHPIVWVPYLDDNMASGSNPTWLIDLKAFFPIVLSGNFFRQIGPRDAAKQPDVKEVFKQITYQHVCINRRGLAQISKSDPAA